MSVNTVCLCGSTRNRDDFDRANRELTKHGLSVITISFAIEKDLDGKEKEPALKEVLDLVHFNKILRADAVLVVGADGYFGFSTSREIIWANMQGKDLHRQIDYLDDESGTTDWAVLAADISDRLSMNKSELTKVANEVLKAKANEQ